jgi:hypothetical protein
MDFYPGIASYGSQGIAIYFPMRQQYFDEDYSDNNANYPIRFVVDTEWDVFLKKYYQNVTN